MADYASLQSDVVDTLKDTQVDAAQAQVFIDRAEYKLERDLLNNQTGGSVPHQMLISFSGTTDANSSYALPANFLKAREVVISNSRARYVSPGEMWKTYHGMSIDADNQPFILHYYKRLPKLTVSNTTNWLLDIAPDAYLWASCLQYVPWGQELEVLALWADFYQDAMRGVKETNGAQPRGGFFGGRPRGQAVFYTISDGRIWFAPTAGVES